MRSFLLALFLAAPLTAADFGFPYLSGKSSNGSMYVTSVEVRNPGPTLSTCSFRLRDRTVEGRFNPGFRKMLPDFAPSAHDATMVLASCSAPVEISTRIQVSNDGGRTFDEGRLYRAVKLDPGRSHRLDSPSLNVVFAEVDGSPVSVRMMSRRRDEILFEKTWAINGRDVRLVELPASAIAHDKPVVDISVIAGEGRIVAGTEMRDAGATAVPQILGTAHPSVQSGPRVRYERMLVASPFKAAPFHDYATGLIYMRDRWYDPKSGTFLTPDRAGYRDSSNPYTYCGGDPVNCTDPTGMYEVDVHHWLTVFLARAAGFDERTARQIGFETQELDMDDPRNAMYGGSNPKAMHLYHMVRPQRLAAMRRQALNTYRTFLNDSAAHELKWRGVGEYIHALQDSYSHQRGKIYRDFNNSFGIVIGHGLRGHEPDWTWKRSAIAMDMARNVFDELRSLCVETNPSTCTALPWSQIQSTVLRFVSFEPRLGIEKVGPFVIPTASATGYQSKIDILNGFSSARDGRQTRLFTRPFQLTDRERAERQNVSRDLDEEERMMRHAASSPQ